MSRQKDYMRIFMRDKRAEQKAEYEKSKHQIIEEILKYELFNSEPQSFVEPEKETSKLVTYEKIGVEVKDAKTGKKLADLVEKHDVGTMTVTEGIPEILKPIVERVQEWLLKESKIKWHPLLIKRNIEYYQTWDMHDLIVWRNTQEAYYSTVVGKRIMLKDRGSQSKEEKDFVELQLMLAAKRREEEQEAQKEFEHLCEILYRVMYNYKEMARAAEELALPICDFEFRSSLESLAEKEFKCWDFMHKSQQKHGYSIFKPLTREYWAEDKRNAEMFVEALEKLHGGHHVMMWNRNKEDLRWKHIE